MMTLSPILNPFFWYVESYYILILLTDTFIFRCPFLSLSFGGVFAWSFLVKEFSLHLQAFWYVGCYGICYDIAYLYLSLLAALCPLVELLVDVFKRHKIGNLVARACLGDFVWPLLGYGWDIPWSGFRKWILRYVQ